MKAIKWMIAITIGLAVELIPATISGFISSSMSLPMKYTAPFIPDSFIIELNFSITYILSSFIIACQIMKGDRLLTPFFFLIKGLAYALFAMLLFSCVSLSICVILSICILIFDIYVFRYIARTDNISSMLFIPELVFVSYLVILLIHLYLFI